MSTLPDALARLVWPAVRASRGEAALEVLRPLFEAGGPGGVIVFGEGAGGVDRLIARLRLAAPGPLLVAADLERGCGQQVREYSSLPPAMALAACTDAQAAHDAGLLTAIEARQAGIDVVFAPVADVNTADTNPIIATRSFGDDPGRVARLAAAFTDGLTEGGVLAVAKHFPGHGSTVQDSHDELARVTRTREELEAIDLVPFAHLVAHGVPGLMVGHLEVPALDPVAGRPATLSPAVVRDVLRARLGHDGLVVTDALDMRGVPQRPDTAPACLRAGCDVLLMPPDPAAALDALRAELSSGALDADLAAAALERHARAEALCARGRSAPPRAVQPDLSRTLLAGSLTSNARPFPTAAAGSTVEVVAYGDDPTGIVVPAFCETLRAHGVQLGPSEHRVGLVMTSVAAHLGTSRLPERERARLGWALERRRLSVLVVLGSPYEMLALPGHQAAILAYEPSPAAAAQAARVVLGRSAAPGRLPVGSRR